MAEYQRIEYRIGQDGKVIETVLSASADRCVDATVGIEQALGRVEAREQLLFNTEDEDNTESIEQQTIGGSG